MGILETRHGIITESVHLIFVRFPNLQSSKERETVWVIFYIFHHIYCLKAHYCCAGTVPHVSIVSVAECPVYN